MADKQENKMSPTTANLAMTSAGFEPTTMEEAWRFSEALAQSGMVPDRYQDKPRDCLIALDLAKRLNASWLAVMQHVYSVHGRLGMEAVLVIGLVNQSRLFVDPLEYEVEGDDAKKANFKVRAFAKRTSTGTVLYGPWIDWDLVKGEGWYDNKGSKWKTMPEQMFHYRAASWFQRRHCPEVTQGMLTTDNLRDMGRKHVESVSFDTAQKAAMEKIAAEQGSEVVDPDTKAAGGDGERDAATQAKVDEEKKKLAAAEKKAKTKAARDAKKKAAKDKGKLPKYHCDAPKCSKPDFEEPNATDEIKGSQCPNCYSWQTHLNGQPVDSDILAEND